MLGPQEQRELAAWLAQDPAHEREYHSLQTVWRMADQLPADKIRGMMEQTEDHRPCTGRRRVLLGAGAALGTAAATAWLIGSVWMPAATFSRHVITARGERRTITLPEGSHIDLNTDTEISIALFDTRRTVRLHRGEALFSVSPDMDRPFSVETDEARILVTGTRFNVRRADAGVMVAVQEGSVELSIGPLWHRERVLLKSGLVSRASREGLITPYRDNVDSITAWQRGRLVFRNKPLSDVAAELSRYLASPLRVADAAVGRLHVSGTLSIEAPEAALDILPQIAPVTVVRRAEGIMLLAR